VTATQQAGRQVQQQDAQPNGQRPPVGEDRPLNPLLQQQIAEALRPVVGDLREQLVQTVQTQLRQALEEDRLGERSDDQDAERREGAPDGPDSRADQPEAAATDRATPQTSSPVRQAIAQLPDLVRRLVATVRSWLSSLIAQLRQLLSGLVRASLMAMIRPLVKAIFRKAISAAQQQGRDKLKSVAQPAS